jgi:hypothetical protein
LKHEVEVDGVDVNAINKNGETALDILDVIVPKKPLLVAYLESVGGKRGKDL